MLRDAQGCSGLLIHRSGYSHVCSGLKVEMEFGEVKIGVRVWWHVTRQPVAQQLVAQRSVVLQLVLQWHVTRQK
jgi:hypothetical protein